MESVVTPFLEELLQTERLSTAAMPPGTSALPPDDAASDRLRSAAGVTLTASVLGFFIVTLDAVVVNVALPGIGADLGGGMTGLQWVVDGYTLMFAALLLSAGSLTDRIGARRALGTGLGLFVVAPWRAGSPRT